MTRRGAAWYRSRMRHRLLIALFSLLGAACGSEAETSPTPPGPAEVHPTPAPEAREVWEDESFELRTTLSAPYAAGAEGAFEVVLRPRGVYHVNQDYPMSIALEGGGSAVTFPTRQIPRESAVEYTETVARFRVPFTPTAAGQQRVTATVDFAVCTPEACMPDTRTLAVALPVQ